MGINRRMDMEVIFGIIALELVLSNMLTTKRIRKRKENLNHNDTIRIIIILIKVQIIRDTTEDENVVVRDLKNVQLQKKDRKKCTKQNFVVHGLTKKNVALGIDVFLLTECTNYDLQNVSKIGKKCDHL